MYGLIPLLRAVDMPAVNFQVWRKRTLHSALPASTGDMKICYSMFRKLFGHTRDTRMSQVPETGDGSKDSTARNRAERGGGWPGRAVRSPD